MLASDELDISVLKTGLTGDYAHGSNPASSHQAVPLPEEGLVEVLRSWLIR